MPSDAVIVGWQKSSFVDYPGTVSTVLFLSGCNLRCPYCHNPMIVEGGYGPIPFGSIREYIVSHKASIEGAVISGGEPSLQGGLKDLCDELKALGLKVKIDTNGLEPEAVIACAPDYIALDIKTSFENYTRLKIPPKYHDYRKRLRLSIDAIVKMGESAEIRITAVPGIVDDDDIENLLPELKGIKKIFIQQFNPTNPMLGPAYSSVKPYPAHKIEGWKKAFTAIGIDCRIRGF